MPIMHKRESRFLVEEGVSKVLVRSRSIKNFNIDRCNLKDAQCGGGGGGNLQQFDHLVCRFVVG